MGNERCPHYGLMVAQVTIPGHYSSMRLPVYRCGLSDVIIERLRSHPEGRMIADTLQTIAADDAHHPHSGPDLRPLHPLTCTLERLEGCKSHFVEHLSAYHQDVSLPAEHVNR